jgi:hypothetical protein
MHKSSGTAKLLVAPDFYDDDPQALNAACKEWLLETYEEEEVTLQKISSNRKTFKKHLTDEYGLWDELNGIALSEIYDSCTQSVQLLIGKKKEKRCRGVEAAGEQFCSLRIRLGRAADPKDPGAWIFQLQVSARLY